MKKVIELKCSTKLYLKLSELHVLQDTETFELKELSKQNFEKLKSRIEKSGFLFPFFVWHSKEENKWYYTDGSQRNKVLLAMQKSGEYELPEKFPCVEIFATDKKEAAKAILLQSTNYGKITNYGLSAFIEEYDFILDFEDLKLDLDLPAIDLDDIIFDLTPKKIDDKDKIEIPKKERNIIVRLSFNPGVWLGKRKEILDIFDKIKKNYECKIMVDE